MDWIRKWSRKSYLNQLGHVVVTVDHQLVIVITDQFTNDTVLTFVVILGVVDGEVIAVFIAFLAFHIQHRELEIQITFWRKYSERLKK